MYINDIETKKEYIAEPTTHNYERMCVELQELIVYVYSQASTEVEKNIFLNTFNKAKKIITPP